MPVSSVSGVAGIHHGGYTRPSPPQALLDRQRSQRAAHPEPPPGSDARDKGWTGQRFFRAGSADFVKSHESQTYDAGRAVAVCENADMWTLVYAYTAHKPKEAWLFNKPADGKLKLNVVTSVSWHVGSNDAEMMKNGKQFARTNEYIVEVVYPNGKRDRKTFKIKNPPEYASISPTFEIDLNQAKGDIHVRGWAKGSAGVGGYIEARETIIHND